MVIPAAIPKLFFKKEKKGFSFASGLNDNPFL